MKKIITMSGSSFCYMCAALSDFTNKHMIHRENADKLELKVNHSDMTIVAYTNNSYMLGQYAASYTDIDAAVEKKFFIRVPPVMPKKDEAVVFFSDEKDGNLTIIVEYVLSGIMFRTTTKSNVDTSFDNEGYMANVVSHPSAIVAVNAQYLKRAIQSLINSDPMVKVNKQPVFIAFSGEADPIRVFSDEKNQRLVLPTRNRKFVGKLHIKTLSNKSIEMDVIKSNGGSCCPSCSNSLKFFDRLGKDRDKVKMCPYCGQHLDFSDQ